MSGGDHDPGAGQAQVAWEGRGRTGQAGQERLSEARGLLVATWPHLNTRDDWDGTLQDSVTL